MSTSNLESTIHESLYENDMGIFLDQPLMLIAINDIGNVLYDFRQYIRRLQVKHRKEDCQQVVQNPCEFQ